MNITRIQVIVIRNFLKTNISYPLIHIRTCVLQRVEMLKNWKNFVFVLNV